MVGVDLEGRSLRALQAARVGDRVHVEAAAELARLDPDAPISVDDLGMLLDVMDRQGFGTGDLVVGVPSADLFSEVLELPPRDSGAPLERLARMEVARVRKCEPDSFELACWDLPAPLRAGEATHMLGVGCAHDSANELLDMFETVGVAVRALDVRACALARSLGAFSGPGVTALVELDWSHTRLVGLLRGVVLYERRIEDACLRHAHAEIVRVLGVEDEVADYFLFGDAAESGAPDEVASIVEATWEGAVEEIGASLSYAEHRYPEADLRRLVACGPGAMIAQTTSLIGRSLGMEAEVLTPRGLAVWDGIDEGCADSPAMVAALGMAMWEE